ncbi:hypothetical protein [Agromyces albus]|uniref:hypothetical protein n=1 Tax=Agromyces albus TaxID=205332 RepID=UPI00277D2C30|nr:hypothetical protein [Agromyces albus]MDQ0576709.1 hypothetical protein [Agromyces albus]
MTDMDDGTMDDATDEEPTGTGKAPKGPRDHGTIPTDTRGDAGIDRAGGFPGVGSIGTDFGAAALVPESLGVDEQSVTIEDDDDPDAIAHRSDSDDDTIAPDGVGPEVRPPS